MSARKFIGNSPVLTPHRWQVQVERVALLAQDTFTVAFSLALTFSLLYSVDEDISPTREQLQGSTRKPEFTAELIS